MRISRFTQFSLLAIATGSAIALGIFVGSTLQGSTPSIALIPFDAISQELDNHDSPGEFEPRQARGALLRSLNLSRPQKAKLFEIQNQYQPDIQTQRKKLQSEVTKLRQLMVSDVPSADVTEQFEQVQTSRRDLNRLNFDGYLAIREVLTLEQRQIFSEQLQARKRRRRHQIHIDQNQ